MARGMLGLDLFGGAPAAPFHLEVAHVPARRRGAGLFMDVGVQEGLEDLGHGRGAAVAEHDLGLVRREAQRIVGHVRMGRVLADDIGHQPPELEAGRGRAAFLLQQVQADGPFALVAAMLARQFVETAFQGAPQPEVVAADRQNLMRADRVEDPVRQLDLDLLHAPLAGLADDAGALDQAEGLEDLLAAGGDVRRDPRPGQPLHRGLEEVVAAARGHPVGGPQQVRGLEADHLADLAAVVQRADQLADAEDQDVAVVDGRDAVAGGLDVDRQAVVLVAARAQVGLGREREDRMLHRAHVGLGRGVDDVADEEVTLRVSVGKKRTAHRFSGT